MSIKRQAPTQLTHENWDQDDSTEHEEMGTFKTAPKEVLEKRVIRTAKRRSQNASDEPKNSAFSGFSGFNKVQQPSFDFLANLTNGAKPINGTPTTKNDTAVSSNIFTNKSLSNSPNTGIFSMSGSSGFATKPTLGKSTEGSLFVGSITSNTLPIQSVFTATKADSTVNDSPFKLQPSPAIDSTLKPTKPEVSTSQVSSSIFGAQSNSIPSNSLFSSKANNATLFSAQAVSSTSTSPFNSGTTTKADSHTTECASKSDQKETKRITYFSKLKGLNESVSDWIKKHVEETPLCILSPIFEDYEKYLKEIQEEYHGGEKCTKNNDNKMESKASPETKSTPPNNNVNSSIFGNLTSSNSTMMEAPQNNKGDISSKSPSLNFGINTSTTTASTGFSFGINPSTASTASSLFSVNTTTTTNANTQFSFGINKSGFGFNAISPKTDSTEVAKEDDDEPPKVDFTPVVEDNSVFDTKCKVFVKNDGNFNDRGVGTLYLKKVEGSGKHQLLVRANNNLGSVLLNLILSSSIPTQRMGKNNVMMVCVPVPDAKPPPVPILIRVKTAEEADELLNTLNKYKA